MEDINFTFLFDIILETFGTDHIFSVFYVLNLIFSAGAYQLGFARKLSPIKTIFVYILLAIGTYIITIFSIFNLPITESLIIITIVLAIYRFRLYQQRKKENSY
ncbi:YlaH-like family protein [Virgibacillus xinjiangensis]|uniref:YlaH-like family protein n=1 Tax=Virgibacillus xinjiangensis TaxID=393090 RepID=A0ABV7CV33_9BACI